MNWQTIFNPFSIFSEKQLAIGGLLLTITGCIIGYYCNSSFNGTLDMHLIQDSKLLNVTLENLINVSVVTISFIGLGKYFNSKTRFIDILNMALWYRLPIYILAILSYLLLPTDLTTKLSNNIHSPEKLLSNPIEIIMGAVLVIFSLLSLPYAIVLLVNGFKTATNTKKWQHWVAFGFVILISEGITQYLIKQLL